MPVTNGKLDDETSALKTSVQTALNLFHVGLKTSTVNSNTPRNSTKINVLEIVHDTASLIRAHSTKLSLLISNEPFTPSAVSRILNELISSLIPSLLFALELCDPKEYSQTMHTEIVFRVTELFSGMRCMITAIPLSRGKHGDGSRNSDDKEKKRDLITIGTVWQSCDALMGLKKDLIAGLFMKKAKEYSNLLQDALEELLEWAEDETDMDDENQIKDSFDESCPQHIVDMMLSFSKQIPNNDTNGIRSRLQSTTKRLRLMNGMFQAVIKRRFKTLPSLPHFQGENRSRNIVSNHEIIKNLDLVLEMMKRISYLTDELAGSFYELDVQQIDKNMDECFSTGVKIAAILKNNWEGQQDNFSVWLSNFEQDLLSEKTI